MTRTLVVWCPDWPLVAAGITADVPAATFHANRVVACTEAARAEGITRGLRRRESQARCPTLLIEHHDPIRDARAFEAVAAVVARFAPAVEITRPGVCALPTRGPSRYFGGDESLAQQVRDAVEVHCDCRVGIADSPFAAQLAARRGLIVPPGDSPRFLEGLPITLLDEPELTDLLIRLGIREIGAFAALTPNDVVGRFGPVGVVAHRRARGLDDRELECSDPPADLSTDVEIDPPADRVDSVAFAGKSLADDLCARLASAGMVCTCIRIEAETEHGERLSRIWRHHRAFSPVTVAERVRWQLEGWLAGTARHDEHHEHEGHEEVTGGTTGGLTLLRLVPEEVIPDRGRQRGFWGGSTEADDRAARGMARLQGLLGPDAVVTAVLGGGRGPAEQVTLIPWGEPRYPRAPGPPINKPDKPDKSVKPEPGPTQVTKAPTAATTRIPGKKWRPRQRPVGHAPSSTEVPVWPGRVPGPFPAIVPPEPVHATLVDATGTLVGVTARSAITAPPLRLSIEGKPWEDIIGWAGPWTADDRWWDTARRRRLSRVQVVVESGAAYLLVLEAGRWGVEATYD